MLGAFATDDFEYRDKTLLFIIWFMHTIITTFVLLNLLISIMGDSFSKIQETKDNNMWKERAGLMVENEKFISWKKLFKGAKYIIIIE